MTRATFEDDTALEREVLRRGLPLIPTVSSGTRITVDQRSGQITIVAVGEGRNKFEPKPETVDRLPCDGVVIK